MAKNFEDDALAITIRGPSFILRELGIQTHNYYGADYVSREECAKICKFIENKR